MSQQEPLEAINMRLARAVQEAVVTGLQAAASDVYRVFRLKETGTCIVLRTVKESDDAECVYGPAGFGDCLKWVNDNS